MPKEFELVLPARYNRHHIWWLICLPLICLAAIWVNNAFRDAAGNWLPETSPLLSTFNKRASGYSGVYELCQKLKLPVARWEEAYRYLTEQHRHGTLVIIGPLEAPTTAEAARISQWVEQGNDLVYLDDFTFRSAQSMLTALDLKSLETIKRKDMVVSVVPTWPEATMVKTIKVSADSRIQGGDAIAADNSGSLLVKTGYGQGRCLIGSVPSFCSNGNLNDPDCKGNFQLLCNWLSSSKAPIYFDEKCHGFTSAANAFVYVVRSPVGYIILQLLIIIAVAFISLNQRFGRPVPVSTARRISNLEFINGLANTYQRAKARDAAWAMIFTPFKARLCKLLGVAPDDGAEKLAAAWADATGKPERDCRLFLERAQLALSAKRMDEGELVKLIAECDSLAAGQKELQMYGKVLGA